MYVCMLCMVVWLYVYMVVWLYVYMVVCITMSTTTYLSQKIRKVKLRTHESLHLVLCFLLFDALFRLLDQG